MAQISHHRIDTNFRAPVRKWRKSEICDLNLRYYNLNIHRAAFVLPEFARKVLQRGETKDGIGHRDAISNEMTSN